MPLVLLAAFAVTQVDSAFVARLKTRNVCGATALCTVAGLVGRTDAFSEVCRSLPPSPKERSLAEVRDTAEAVGLDAIAIDWRTEKPDFNSAPAILRLHNDAGGGHFVVVAAAAGSQVLIVDPLNSVAWYSLADLREVWGGVGLHIAADADGLTPVRNRLYATHLQRRFRSPWTYAVAALALAVGMSLSLRSAHAGVRRAMAVAVLTLAGVALIIVGVLGQTFVGSASPSISLDVLGTPLRQEVAVSDVDPSTPTGDAESVEAVVRLTNATNRSIPIDFADTGCSCAEVEGCPPAIPAQVTVPIVVKIDMRGSDRRSVELVVRFGDGVLPTALRFEIQAVREPAKDAEVVSRLR